ncbi:hypothetical protein [Urbifossiella limnaea]|uniref:DUF1772 domain-containing protein n=1 Tax=Urbifossiella limnaea TaxID=2528023 RepID=A0A517XM17_9BACT|nr:hypothetical protein [Urbifossiella limnaea]QDU18516.1 hypothetical protein ETAA1_04060 [Urbifossiella limnaea]
MPDEIARGVVLLHLAATLFLVGLIWFVQVVHYPLMARVGRAEFVAYEQAHARRTTWVVAPPMLVELGTGIALLWVRPAGVSLAAALAGVALLAVVWGSTRFVQVPCHERLSRAFDPGVHRRLVSTNWVRTAAWSLRGILAVWMVTQS